MYAIRHCKAVVQTRLRHWRSGIGRERLSTRLKRPYAAFIACQHFWAQATERHGCAPALTGAQLWPPMHACKAGYRNHILAALPIAEIELLRPHLSRMTMVSGQVLHEADSPITDVFFIENGVVSLAADTHDEGRVEVGLLGREGFAGSSVLLNADPWSVHRAFAQVAGDVYRMVRRHYGLLSSDRKASGTDACATLRC